MDEGKNVDVVILMTLKKVQEGRIMTREGAAMKQNLCQSDGALLGGIGHNH
jgi:hypothetical protein